jgi:hypothetical protein
LITHRESRDAIKAFAGADYEKAVYFPQDEKFLLPMLLKVEHYEILSSPWLCEVSPGHGWSRRLRAGRQPLVSRP